jgi:hypothetical protein
MSTHGLVHKSLLCFLYITQGKGGFLITIPGRTDIIGRVVTSVKDLDKQRSEINSSPIGHSNINIELLLIEETTSAIYLTPALKQAHECLIINLMNCRGGLNIFNHREKDIYIKRDAKITRTNPVIVPINKAISSSTAPPGGPSIEDILQTTSNNFYVDFHYGRQCFLIYFPYNPAVIAYIKQNVTECHYAFNFDDCSWKIDQCCSSDVLKLLEFIDQSADTSSSTTSH